jgi:type II secretion system protein D
VFPLAKADARKIATTVQGLFRENLPNQILPITVSADERINAIVVSCGETDAKRIGELIQKLDTDQVAKVNEIRVFPLQYARADALSTILNTALNTKPAPLNEQSPNAQSVLQFITRTTGGRELVTAALKEAVLITPDPRMNSLIVSAPVDYMGLLEQVITRLDASSPQQAKIKVFAMRNADARQMATLITQLFKMTPTAAAAGQRSIQYTLVRPAVGDGTGGPDEQLASATLGTAEQTALTVTIDPRTNSLLVGGTDHYVKLVSEIIDSLDSSQAHERSSEVIRLRNSQAADVATAIRNFLDQERQKLIQALGADAAVGVERMLDQEVAVVSEPMSNTLLLSANQRYFDQVRNIIEQIDRAQPQVLIQVLLAEVTLDNNSDLGMEWKYTGNKSGYNYTTGTDFGVAEQAKTLGGYSAAVTGSDFSFMLRALKEQGRLEVLSRPQIVTADNKPASINIGQRVPLIDQSRLDAQNNLTTSFRYEDVGVNLTVTPKISQDGFVKMEIGTTNSAISSSNVQINKSSTVPIINQRKANTTVSAQSGQTIIIGGLISTTDDRRVKKMPWLGDIPYLGAMFRSTSVTRERKELLILLTPQVLENGQNATPLQDPDEVTREQIDGTGFKSLMKGDAMQRRLVEPLYSTNAPLRRVRPPAPVLTPKETK